MSTEEQVKANYYYYVVKYLKDCGITVSGDIGLCCDNTVYSFKNWTHVVPEPTMQDLMLISPNDIKCVINYYTKCTVNIVTELESNYCVSTGAVVAYDDGNGLKLYIYDGVNWIKM